MASKSFEFFFDIVCPYAYIASHHVDSIAMRTNSTMVLKPVLLGAIFKANEVHVAAKGSFADTMSPQKRRYMSNDLFRFAKLRKVDLNNFPSHHPVRSLLALRTLLYLSSPESQYQGPKLDMWLVAKRLFKAYWLESIDISNASMLSKVIESLGVDDALNVIEAANADHVVQESLKSRTQEAIDRGLFGVPSFFVTINGQLNDYLIYGQDNLELLESKLGGSSPILAHFSSLMKHERRVFPIDFYFDFSSPFTYLAAMRIEEMFGAENVSFKPILLGAVFRTLGMHNSPRDSMSTQKQAWNSSQLFEQIENNNLKFQFASRFPIRTILPLRMVLAVGPDSTQGRKLIKNFFIAFWANDLDPTDKQTCQMIADQSNLDGKLLIEQAQTEQIKNALQQSTQDALEKGVFGVPTVAVKKPNETNWFWGNDRLMWAFLDAQLPSSSNPKL